MCYVLLEVSPLANPFLVRQLTFLPFATISISQLIGCPQATFLNQYLLPASNYSEFRHHLSELKKQGLLLDFQVQRVRRTYNLINLNAVLGVMGSSATFIEHVDNYEQGPSEGSHLTEGWRGLRGWFRQLLNAFQWRSFVPGAVTYLDHTLNYRSFQQILQDTFITLIPLETEEIAPIVPLLGEYRNVAYVISVLRRGTWIIEARF